MSVYCELGFETAVIASCVYKKFIIILNNSFLFLTTLSDNKKI